MNKYYKLQLYPHFSFVLKYKLSSINYNLKYTKFKYAIVL